MTRLATAQSATATFNAYLWFSLNGLHNIEYQRPLCEWLFFYIYTPFDASIVGIDIKKSPILRLRTLILNIVGMTRFELATTRPPDVYSNRAELHPEKFLWCKDNNIFPINAN